MKKEIRLGVIGAGYMGKAYAIALNSVSTVFSLPARAVPELIATASGVAAALKAEAFGFPALDGRLAAAGRRPGRRRRRHLLADLPPQGNGLRGDRGGKARPVREAFVPIGARRQRHGAGGRARRGQVAGRFQLHEKPSDAARQADDRERRDWRDRPFPRRAQRRLPHGPLHPHELAPEEGIRQRSGRCLAISPRTSSISRTISADPWLRSSATARPSIVSVLARRATRSRRERRPDQFPVQIRKRRTRRDRSEPNRRRPQDGTNLRGDRHEGRLFFDQERLAELRFYSAADPSDRRGYRTLLIGPEHPDYGAFCVGAGHGFSYNDMIVVEMKDMIEGVLGGRPVSRTFRDAVHTALVVDRAVVPDRAPLGEDQ